MCIIVAKGTGRELPDRDVLKTCFENNPDGAGYMILKADEEKIRINKGFMSFKKFRRALAKENITEDDLVVLHFRIGTSGKKKAATHTHPFPLSLREDRLKSLRISTQMALAHNGVMNAYADEIKDFSDTMAFTKKVVASKYVKDSIFESKALQTLVSDHLRGDRLVIMDAERRTFLMFNDWEEDEGIYYSNSSYKRSRTNWGVVKVDNDYDYSNHYYGNNRKDHFESCEECGINYVTTEYRDEYYMYLCHTCYEDYNDMAIDTDCYSCMNGGSFDKDFNINKDSLCKKHGSEDHVWENFVGIHKCDTCNEQEQSYYSNEFGIICWQCLNKQLYSGHGYSDHGFYD